MKAPKILAVASAVDLDFRYGCTPAWWQLWKGLYEVGVDLIVTPYRGKPVESPWWRTAPNPTRVEGESYAAVRGGLARLKGDRYLRRSEDNPDDSVLDKAARETIWRLVTPRWRRHLTRVLEREKDVDAVIVFSPDGALPWHSDLPAGAVRRPGVFYDGDVPMSLPEFGGMDTGFNYYHGADPSEYDLVVSNSEGGLPSLLELGARRAEAVFWGADPEFFAPPPVEKLHDVFFYGYGDKFRRDWMAAMVGEPSRAAPELEFALGGRDFQGDTGRAWLVGDVPFNAFAHAISSSRINLNITRRSHASVTASSSCRPFDSPLPAPRSSRTPTRGSSAGSSRAGAARRQPRRRGAYGVPRAARRPGPGRGDGRSCTRARPRRAHVRPSRPPAALAGRPRCPGGRACLSAAASRSSPPGMRRRPSAASSRSCERSIPSSTCS